MPDRQRFNGVVLAATKLARHRALIGVGVNPSDPIFVSKPVDE